MVYHMSGTNVSKGHTSIQVTMRFALIILCTLTLAKAAGPEVMPTPITRGSDYLQNCKFVEDQQSQQYYTVNIACMSWTSGFHNAAFAADIYHQQTQKPVFCSGDGATTGQVVHIILKYIKDHPELEHLSAGQLAYSAMTEAFGCKS